jgi:type IV pilus assembly protein PilQ
VSPKIYVFNGTPFVYLGYHVDQSTPSVSASGTTIDHKKADGTLLMLDGERTYVSGLVTTSQNTVRQGIPVLKDLPWWVFGLRYIFGYDRVSTEKRELIMIIDAKLEPTVEERIASEAKNTEKASLEKAKQLREQTDTLLKKQ